MDCLTLGQEARRNLSLSKFGNKLLRGLPLIACLAGLGCFGKETTLPVQPTAEERAKLAKREASLPKRNPQPATCVAFALVREQMANDPKCSATDRRNHLDEAKRSYQQALRLDPKHQPAHVGLARVYEGLGEQAHVRKTFETAHKALPKNAVLAYSEGMYWARQKEWEKSIQFLRTAQKQDPDNRAIARDLAFTLARVGQFEESVEVFKTIGGEASGYYFVAKMLRHMKDDERSQQYAAQALALQPDMEPAKQLLAELRGEIQTGVDGAAAEATSPAPPASPVIQQATYQESK